MKFSCFHCGEAAESYNGMGKPRYCDECGVIVYTVRDIVQSIVYRAKFRGILPRLTGDIPCVDCGKPACDLDHRDYGKPLEVEPTCRSCNLRRGPARLPDDLTAVYERIKANAYREFPARFMNRVSKVATWPRAELELLRK